MTPVLTHYQRFLMALGGRKPDRVPVFLPLTLHGARELDVSVEDYFADGRLVGEGQLRLQRKFGQDALFLEYYAAAEAMAFGAEVVFPQDGQPNMGAPPLDSWRRAGDLAVPNPLAVAPLRESLRAIEYCSERVKGTIPIVGVALAPFSLASLLLGLDRWLELLLFGEPGPRDVLLRVTAEFCALWANAQLAAGADVVLLPDGASSGTIISREQFTAWSLPVLCQTLARIDGPVVLAGVGRCEGIAALLPQSGARGVLVTAEDDVPSCMAALAGQMALMGNLNNIAMLGWGYEEARRSSRQCLENVDGIAGFCLAPQWEIPFGVGDDALAGIVDAAIAWGQGAVRDSET